MAPVTICSILVHIHLKAIVYEVTRHASALLCAMKMSFMPALSQRISQEEIEGQSKAFFHYIEESKAVSVMFNLNPSTFITSIGNFSVLWPRPSLKYQ